MAALTISISCGDDFPPSAGDVLSSNFHVIEEGQAYRSAQPSAEELASVIEQYGIRTVINLRGSVPDTVWYQEEARVCREMGVTLADHTMSQWTLPSAELLEAITATLLDAEYPILIHCQWGADRTGAIAAIYRMLVLGQERADALAELSPRYFHFRCFTPCMDTLAEIYEPDQAWLTEYAETVDQMVCTP